ncbi:MAG: ATP-binding cassette domain-containing protein [Bacillota bacterium]|nr:ATP-binding cassette domain-containing protein [Bacillota bacterium]
MNNILLNAEKVNLIYDMGKSTQTYAVKDINLSLMENTFYGILGPSGSGKSSLLYLLSGLKKPSSGKIIFEGNDIQNFNNKELSDIRKNNFGFIFQRHFLINYMTALENVLVPLNSNSDNDIKKAKELLENLDLQNDIDKKPYQLSGGQRQRVAIARALINNPRIIFADEITASLDHSNAFEVMHLIKSICKNACILVVTHDESILSDADKIIHIWDGSISKVEDINNITNSTEAKQAYNLINKFENRR